jgi:hypothetical protein
MTEFKIALSFIGFFALLFLTMSLTRYIGQYQMKTMKMQKYQRGGDHHAGR